MGWNEVCREHASLRRLSRITFEARGEMSWVGVVSDGVCFRDGDMTDSAGLPTLVSGQVRKEGKWEAHMKDGKTFIFFNAREGIG